MEALLLLSADKCTRAYVYSWDYNRMSQCMCNYIHIIGRYICAGVFAYIYI